MKNQETIYFAGGCFWGVEAAFRKFMKNGILETEVGYAGGIKVNPNYQEVCSGKTGHTETVKVVFDYEQISLESLLDLFWKMHDPTSLNKQGNDVGSQYRSAIFYTNEKQKDSIEKNLSNSKLLLGKTIVTEIKPITVFYPAEEYHQKYLEKNPFGYCHINIDTLNLNNETKS